MLRTISPLTCTVIQQFKLIKKRFNILNLEYAVKWSSSRRYITFNFTPDEEEKILNTLNQSKDEELMRYSVSQSKAKKILSWKSKMGPFKSLNEILEVDGLTEKALHKICKNIVFDNELLDENSTKFIRNKPKKLPKQLVIPAFEPNYDINSVTGIYISATGISWAQICRPNNTLTHWNMDQFHVLPKKMSLIDTFESAISLIRRIPPSDIYVFENIAPLSPTGQTQSVMVSSHNQQQDLTAMLLTLLNTSISHNVSLQKQDQSLQEIIENQVHFIKSKLPARVFKLVIGNEKVSAIEIVSQLLENSTANSRLVCTPVSVDLSTKTAFREHATANQELLGQALLVVVTFMDLFVYNNSKTWSALLSRNKKIS